jgi:hypothetical protein
MEDWFGVHSSRLQFKFQFKFQFKLQFKLQFKNPLHKQLIQANGLLDLRFNLALTELLKLAAIGSVKGVWVEP